MGDALVNLELDYALATALIAAFVGGLARGFSGFGAGLIFMPLAAAALGPRVAAPVLLIVDAVLILPYVRAAIAACERRSLLLMVAGAYLGIPLGVFLLASLDPIALRWGIAVLSVAMLALLMSGFRLPRTPRPPATLAVGAVAGAMTASVQVGGPPVVVYWLSSPLAPKAVRANLILFFLATTAGAAIGYALAGLFTGHVLALALVVGPAYATGLFLGTRLFGAASERVFRSISYALIALAALLSLPVLDGVLR